MSEVTRISAALPSQARDVGTKIKQAEWDLYKIQQRQERKETRGVPVTIAEVRKKPVCTCVHTKKHHRRGGGCRKGCDCNAGIR